MTFAEGVSFDEALHEYFYKGQILSGVTGLISKHLGYKWSGSPLIEQARAEGSLIHKTVSEYINTGILSSTNDNIEWVVDSLPKDKKIHSEVLVSDLSKYASAIDIVLENPDGTIDIADIKKGEFHRDYVSLQLGIYKYFAENFAGKKVSKCFCVCCKDKIWYPVIPCDKQFVKAVLYG